VAVALYKALQDAPATPKLLEEPAAPAEPNTKVDKLAAKTAEYMAKAKARRAGENKKRKKTDDAEDEADLDDKAECDGEDEGDKADCDGEDEDDDESSESHGATPKKAMKSMKKVMKAMKAMKAKSMKSMRRPAAASPAKPAAKLQLGCKSCRGAALGCKTCRQPSFSGWRGDREAWEKFGFK
jgi:hypothetical protein